MSRGLTDGGADARPQEDGEEDAGDTYSLLAGHKGTQTERGGSASQYSVRSQHAKLRVEQLMELSRRNEKYHMHPNRIPSQLLQDFMC
ncbi:hypothetical protein NDU88_010347 [Pleurodeles waltl]|uniref:Uncharacterized protein n=1 Tax=Pleurodeles waltl TaxID=8319 RepID=A0AAV7QVL9_PLEWA|nr:hypothetical protein NDU88_010347 [Pleurodeles waltl]